ncbi:MAG: site-specific integrase [Candidatus Endonucleobacter sp. (ex Gigantidas childressi)]|nr:site-specific integrase [Candidatus Endonucleobacter sp. (ex Gigantidas childressi)]
MFTPENLITLHHELDSTKVISKHHPQEPSNLIGARDDNNALTLFLKKAGTRSMETLRRYERETIRFTVFIYQVLRIDYKSVRLKHLQDYLDFIQNLPECWLKPGAVPSRPNKILFNASIKQGKSTDQVIDVLSAFFNFLDKNRYTLGNPTVSLVRSGEKIAKGSTVIRYFYDNEWMHVKKCLDTLPACNPSQLIKAARTRYIMAITYGLALRQSEITSHSCSDIQTDGKGDFLLNILGKGRKRRHLPINRSLFQKINDFRNIQGVGAISDDAFPLAPQLRKHENSITSLSSRGLRFWWQSFMNHCAYQSQDPLLAKRLKEIPFHSLRHTSLTHLARKMDIEDLAIFAGHDSINTTSQYYHAETKRLRSLTAQHGL